MEHWTELRSALHVARLGTVMGAADALGVHRATINRHIDTLENYLGVPLFQRHARGYTLTDTGRDMMTAAGRADEIFMDFLGRAGGLTEKLSGTLKITSLAGLAPLILPAVDDLHQKHPEISIEFIADEQLARLEYGEAHVAIRTGPRPTTPDYVVLPFRSIRIGLYASKRYIDNYGKPLFKNLRGSALDIGNTRTDNHSIDKLGTDELRRHAFVGPGRHNETLPYTQWLNSHIPSESFVLRTSSQQAITAAVKQGLGLGFVAEHEARSPRLTQIIPPADDWSVPLWLVTHADLRRTLKVQEFIRIARA
jgi:DNA-binding transcriptional LysR family regulator